MARFARRRWGLGATCFALAAVVSQYSSIRHASLGMTVMARATAEGTVETQRSIAGWHAHRSDLWRGLGSACALLAVGCWAVAYCLGEAGTHVGLVILLIAYLLLFLLLV